MEYELWQLHIDRECVMRIYNILKTITNVLVNRGTRSLGGINPNSSMTITIPSSHFALLVLHGVYTSNTGIVELYCNSSGTSYARVMAVPETATTRDFTITTATNSITVANNSSQGYITDVHLIGNRVDDYSVS